MRTHIVLELLGLAVVARLVVKLSVGVRTNTKRAEVERRGMHHLEVGARTLHLPHLPRWREKNAGESCERPRRQTRTLPS